MLKDHYVETREHTDERLPGSRWERLSSSAVTRSDATRRLDELCGKGLYVRLVRLDWPEDGTMPADVIVEEYDRSGNPL